MGDVSIAVPFGQYVPVDSPVHRLDARVKLVLGLAFAVALFGVGGWAGLVAAAVLAGGTIAISKVPLRLALRGLRAIGVILAFTILANALRWAPATVTLVRVGALGVDPEGLARGLFFAARIVLLVAGTSLLTLTTTPVELTDALERLMSPLERIGVRTGEFAMMLTVALRFIPTTAEEAERVIVAQTARGARLDEGGPVRRARAYAPVLIPMFVNLFRRADELAVAMESRCYRGGKGRTRLRESRMRPSDWASLLGGVALLATIALAL